MKKILISTIHSLNSISNGSIVRVIEEVKFLKNHNFDVYLIGNKTKKSVLNQLQNELGIHLYSLSWISYISSSILSRFNFFGVGWFTNQFIKFDLKRIIKIVNPDLIQSEAIYEGLILAKICKNKKIPFVLSEHNVESVLFKSVLDQEIKICNLANHITTVSDIDKKILEKMGVNSQIKVIPNGVDTKKFQYNSLNRLKLRKKLGIKSTDIILVYHGTLNHFPNRIACDFLKNNLIPAIVQINDNIKLLLIGPKHNNLISEKIIEINTIPSEKLPEYLSLADIAIVPLMFGSGTRLKILEYFSLGIPVISTKIGAEGLSVIDNEHILITNGDVHDIIEKINRLIIDQSLYNKLRENSNNLVIGQYDWQILFNDYLDLYSNIFSEKMC